MFSKSVRKFVRDSSGATAVLFAVTMPVVLGGLGFGAEVGMWYFNQRKLQNAADVAAYSAATELRAGRPLQNMETAASDAATETGYVPNRGSLVTTWPPDDGAFTANNRAVEIEIEESLPRTFSSIFGAGTVLTAGRAVALISEGVPTCVLALHPSASGAVTFTGSTGTILVGCNVHSNSLAGGSAIVNGAASVQADCLSASGTVSVNNGLTLTSCTAPYEHADIVPDPYAAMAIPAVPAGCTNNPNNTPQSVITVSPGTFCSLDFKGDVTLQPGVYVIKGDLTINSTATVRGNGVTLYFDGTGTTKFNGGATIQLSAPTTGPFAGMLMFGDRNAAVTHVINGNSSSFFNGALYARRAAIQMLGGGSAAGGCTQVVAQTVVFSGNSQVGMDCTGWGVQDIRTARLITIVE
jgi:hypothetical protein